MDLACGRHPQRSHGHPQSACECRSQTPTLVRPIAISYGIAFWFLSLALGEGMPLGVAYGLWSACGVALVCLLARAIWKDPLTRRALIGIGFIVLGVILVEIG